MRVLLASFVAVLLPVAPVAVLSGPGTAQAKPPAKICPASAADESAAARAAASCHGRVLVTADQNEKTQVFANPNGSLTAQVAAVAQRVKDGSGKWVKPDPTLHRGADGRVTPAATVLAMSFSGGGTGAAARIGKGSAELDLRWSAKLPAPTISGSNATYAEVLPGVDLVLTAQAEGFAEMLVVKNATAAANPALGAVHFATTTKGLRLKQGKAGDVTAVDTAGATVFGSGTPAMWDSSKTGDPSAGASRLTAAGAAHRAMPVQLDGGGLVIHPDVTMLRNKATKFPVYIDPSIGKASWTMINSDYTTQSYWSYDRSDCPSPYTTIQCAKVGYTTSPTSMIYRSLFAFSVSSILDKHVQDAKLSMDTVYSYTNTDYGTQVHVAGNISSSTTWSNNASSWGATVATANSHAYDRVRRRTEWGVTKSLQTASGGTATTLTFGLRAVSETSVSYWKKFDAGTALLTVTYNSYPNAPSAWSVNGSSCVKGASRPYVRTLTPTLTAKLSDPDGTVRLLKGTFFWWKSGAARSATNSVAKGSIVSGQTATVTIPSGKLTDGATYVVQAITNDGIDNGQYSATCEFTVDVTAPAPPNAVTSTAYPSDGQAHGGVGTAGSFTFKPPATVPADFSGYSYTWDPGATAATGNQVIPTTPADHSWTGPLTPTVDKSYNLRVWTRDLAGNYSTTPFTYAFTVRAGTGPDARWTFDDQTGTDVSEHGNTATVTATTTSPWTPGRGSFTKALLADGTSTAAVTTGPVATHDPLTGGAITVHSNGAFTVAATVRLDSTAGSGQRVIIAQDGTHTSPFLLSYSVAEKKWRFAVAATDVDAPTTAAVLSNAVATTGAWTYLVATYDTSHALKLYVNGTLQTATATSTTFDATGRVTIGRARQASAPAGYFAGAIDDVRLYGRAILTTEKEFTDALRPNPPLVTFPNGVSGYAGKSVSVVLDGGGDPTVTKIQYRLDTTSTWSTAILPTPGGQLPETVPTTAAGTPALLTQTVDSSSRVSDIWSNFLQIKTAPGLTGLVTDADTSLAVAGATVMLSPGGLTKATDSTGAYSFTGINPGTYTVTVATAGSGCASKIATTDVDVDGAVTIDLLLATQADIFGYTCRTAPNTPYIQGTTKISLTGEENVAGVPLPFAMPYYGTSFNTAYVSTSGALTFIDPDGLIPVRAVSLPDRTNAPRAALIPFLDLIVIDDQSGVWTTTVGTGTNQRFVIEWRNVELIRPDQPRINFEVVLSPTGDVEFNYSGLTTDYTEGAGAAVGLTSLGGGYGLQYSFDSAALASGTAIDFTYPEDPWPLPYGSVSGRATADGQPLGQTTVWLDSFQTKTDSTGHYEFDNIEAGTYGLNAASGCDLGDDADVIVDSDIVADLDLTPLADEYGYHCGLTESQWIPGVTDVTPILSSYEYVDFPFAFPFYGDTFSSAQITPLGVYVGAEGPPTPGCTCDDFDISGDIEISPHSQADSDATTRLLTAEVGTAPNRKFVIEWRNLTFMDYPDLHGNFEMVFGEDGTVTMTAGQMPDVSQLPSDWTAWFYSHKDYLITYREDGRGFPSGKSLVFYPPSP